MQRIPVLDFVQYGSDMRLEQATTIDVAIKSSRITSAADLREIGFERAKHWMVDCTDTILLGRLNRILGIIRTGVGDINGITFDPDEVIKPTLFRTDCTAFIVVYYHRHGDVTPSPENIQAFRFIHTLSQRIHRRLIDFMILSSEGNYFSFVQQGYLTESRGTDTGRNSTTGLNAEISQYSTPVDDGQVPAGAKESETDANPAVSPLRIISEESGGSCPVEFDREQFFRSYRLVRVSRGLRKPPERQRSGRK